MHLFQMTSSTAEPYTLLILRLSTARQRQNH